MTFLITGGSGFIGTWVLRELLARDERCVVYDLSPRPDRWQRILGPAADKVILENGDLIDRTRLAEVWERHAVSHVIHLAALLTPACQRDPWLGCQVNVMGSVAVWEEARRHGEQLRGMSYASSLAVFGPEPDSVLAAGPQPVASEEAVGAVLQPPTFYGAFKLAVEGIANQYWRHFRLPTVGIRPHVVYGPERDQGLTAGPSLAARAAVEGTSYTIGYTGIAGYDYVEDVARAFVRSALETPAGAAVVDLPSEPASVPQIVDLIDQLVPGARSRLSITGDRIPSNIPAEKHLISTIFPDWSPTSLRDGLRQTIDYYRR